MVNVGNKAAKKRKSVAGGDESPAVTPKKPNLDATQPAGKNKTPAKQQTGSPQQKDQNKTPAKKPQPGSAKTPQPGATKTPQQGAAKTPQPGATKTQQVQKGGNKTPEKKLKVFPGTGNLNQKQQTKKNEKPAKAIVKEEDEDDEEDESSESDYEGTDEAEKAAQATKQEVEEEEEEDDDDEDEDDDEDDDGEEVEEEESDDDEEEEESGEEEEGDDDEEDENNAENKNEQANKEKNEGAKLESSKPFVVVKNLEHSLTQEDVENHFKPVVDFEKVIIKFGPTGLNKGMAYIQLKDENDIRKALSLHQTKINDRLISIYIGMENYLSNKRPFVKQQNFQYPFSPRGRGGMNRGRGNPRGGRGGPGARGGRGRGGHFSPNKPHFQQQKFVKKQNGVNTNQKFA